MTTKRESASPIETRLAALEAELARVKGLAEGAQRACFRVHSRLEDLGASLVAAADLTHDPYGVSKPLDAAIRDEEDGRAARIIRDEPVDDEQ